MQALSNLNKTRSRALAATTVAVFVLTITVDASPICFPNDDNCNEWIRAHSVDADFADAEIAAPSSNEIYFGVFVWRSPWGYFQNYMFPALCAAEYTSTVLYPHTNTTISPIFSYTSIFDDDPLKSMLSFSVQLRKYVKAIVGPFVDEHLIANAYLAKYFDQWIFAQRSKIPSLSDKKMFPTVVRMTSPLAEEVYFTLRMMGEVVGVQRFACVLVGGFDYVEEVGVLVKDESAALGLDLHMFVKASEDYESFDQGVSYSKGIRLSRCTTHGFKSGLGVVFLSIGGLEWNCLEGLDVVW